MSLLAYKRRAEGTTHVGETFSKMDLRSMLASGAKFKECIFTECDLDLSDLRGAHFENCEFHKCSMRLVSLHGAVLEDVTFVGCDMEQTSFMGSSFRLVLFQNCRMAYGVTLFQDVNARGAVLFDGCNLHGSNMDFREVDLDTIEFRDCNLWGIRVSMGCGFWNGKFDERAVQQFLALVGRVSRNPRVIELAGEQFAVVERAMDGRKRWDRDSTTSPATGSPPIRSYQGPMELTATATTTPTAETKTRSDP